jgi:hypothetical protein
METVITALAPILAGGLALQQLLEFLGNAVDQYLNRQHPGDDNKGKRAGMKGIILSYVALIAGFIITWGAGFRILESLGYNANWFVDGVLTALVVSGGTEGINSIVKFLGYKKDEAKGSAQQKGIEGAGEGHQ